MRTASVARKTNETDIRLSLNLDGTGKSAVDSGVGFLDHMLTLLSRHGGLDLEAYLPAGHPGGRPPQRGGHRHRLGGRLRPDAGGQAGHQPLRLPPSAYG